MSPSPLRLHRMPRAYVRVMAAALCLVVTGLTFATQDMGYTRDESFYFHYAESYQAWFVDLERANDLEEVRRVFGRDAVLETWSGNFEHPPLMKVLFGFAWRTLARKDRSVTSLASSPEGLVVTAGAGPASGFEVDAAVELLSPLAQGQDPSDRNRVLGRGRVLDRERDHLRVHLEVAPARAEEIAATCREDVALPPAELFITGCQVREVRSLAMLDEASAMRLFGIISGGLAFMLTFLLGELLFGWLVGLLGACLFYFVPEHFFHAHLTCFDMPIVAAQLFALYAFWRGLSDRRWALVTAIAWGLALTIKHNAFFLPVGLLLWWLWCGRDAIAIRWSRGGLRLPPMPIAFPLMLVVGLLMLFVFWPKLWFDPLRAVRDYFHFHLAHEHYMQYWFGDPLQVPPFPVSFPFVKSAVTYPEVLSFFGLVGLWVLFPLQRFPAWLKRWRTVGPDEHVAVFVAINALLPLLVIALPSTPIFGGIKHWMTGTPFLGLIAAYGIVLAMQRIRIPLGPQLAYAALLCVYPISASLSHAWVGTGYHNSLIAGGLEGAAEKRLMRLFWGYTTHPALPWLNRYAPRNARVFWQNTTPGSVEMYRRMGLLRHDIRYHYRPAGAQIALVSTNQAFFELDQQTRLAMDLPGPQQVVTHAGVPFLAVYARPGLLPDDAFAPEAWKDLWR